MKHTLTFLTALLLAPLGFLRAAESAAAPAGPPPGRQWKIVFSDEFEGKTLDPAKWGSSRHGQWRLKDIKTELTPTNSFLDGQGHFINVLSRDEAGVLRYHHGIDTKGTTVLRHLLQLNF